MVEMLTVDRIRRKDSINQMSISNLSIIFGPTLLSAPPNEAALNLEHQAFQCKVSHQNLGGVRLIRVGY